MTVLREINAGETSFDELVAALAASGLPTEDLRTEPFRYYSWDDRAWGGIGVGEDALLRSVLVRSDSRGSGVGRDVVEALAVRAKADGVRRLWLLTTDASAFFARLGWTNVDRSEAPAVVESSSQFSSLCPASAALMVRAL